MPSRSTPLLILALCLALLGAAPAAAQQLPAGASYTQDSASALYYPGGYAQDRFGGLLSGAMPGLIGAAAGGLIGYRFGGAMGAVLGGLGGYLAGQLATQFLGGPNSASYNPGYAYRSDTLQPYSGQAAYTDPDGLVSYAEPFAAGNTGIDSSFQPLAPGNTGFANNEGRRKAFLAKFDKNGNGTLDADERPAVQAVWEARRSMLASPALQPARDAMRTAFTAYQTALKAGGAAEGERAAFEKARTDFHAALKTAGGR